MDPSGTSSEGGLHVQHSFVLYQACRWLSSGSGLSILNKQRQQEPIKETYETLAHIKKEQPRFFSTVDLSGLAWQMMLNQEQATTTAFTLPGQGQFQWTQTPLGILGAEALFHQLLTSIFRKLPGLLVHVNRLILFNQTWEQHTQNLAQVLALLERHQLKVNPDKTRMGTDDASVMGFHIESGIVKMDPDQLGNIKKMHKGLRGASNQKVE